MQLSTIMIDFSATGLPDRVFTGVTADSRLVRPGYLFAALPGNRVDGRTFIADAIARGAVAVLAAPGTVLPAGSGDGAGAGAGQRGVVLIEDEQPRRRFAQLAAAFHGRQPRRVVAVTGTNGKTSTVQFVRHLWQALGYPGASLGTLGLQSPVIDRGGSLTTPDPSALHEDLAALARAGVEHVAMEASSHGLAQFRLDGVQLAAAGFTNLSRDHLDYHGSMESYFAAKLALFERVMPAGGTAVLNADAPAYAELASVCTRRSHRVLSYGAAGHDLVIRVIDPLPHGQRVAMELLGRKYEVELALAGRFQVWNVLCALGLVLAGLDRPEAALETLLGALGRLRGVPGRMQLVATHPRGAPIFVDYAHTPDALETVLSALRPHARRRLVVVFGCGGDRDAGKRPLMGEIGARLADRAIITDDNPRSETPGAIRRAVIAGATRPVEEIGDRAQAITVAIEGLAGDDVLVIAGKGHEQGQIIGAEVRPFDDAAVARAVVARLGGGAAAGALGAEEGGR